MISQKGPSLSSNCCKRVGTLLYRVVLTQKLPPNCPQAVADRLHEFDQQVGLLVPKPLPDLPQIPLELLPNVVTQMELHYLGKQELSVEQFKAAESWCVLDVTCTRSSDLSRTLVNQIPITEIPKAKGLQNSLSPFACNFEKRLALALMSDVHLDCTP